MSKPDYDKFKAGKPLTRKGAIGAQCYECNNGTNQADDCLAKHCPLYQWSPWAKKHGFHPQKSTKPTFGRVKKEGIVV